MKHALKIRATNGTIYKSSTPKITHHQTIPPHRHPQIVSTVAGLGASQWINDPYWLAIGSLSMMVELNSCSVIPGKQDKWASMIGAANYIGPMAPNGFRAQLGKWTQMLPGPNRANGVPGQMSCII